MVEIWNVGWSLPLPRFPTAGGKDRLHLWATSAMQPRPRCGPLRAAQLIVLVQESKAWSFGTSVNP